jgi:hypothetical protein
VGKLVKNGKKEGQCHRGSSEWDASGNGRGFLEGTEAPKKVRLTFLRISGKAGMWIKIVHYNTVGP